MWFLLIFAVSTLVEMLLQRMLRPKIQKRGPGELKEPMAEQGHPLPVVFGTARLEAPNAVWWGKTGVGDMGNGLFEYWAALQLGLCHGPVDRVTRIWIGDKLTKPTADLSGARVPVGKAQNVVGASTATSISAWPTSPTPGSVFISNPSGGYTDANSGTLAGYVPGNQKDTKLVYNPYSKGAPIPKGWFIVFNANLTGYPGSAYVDNYWYQTDPANTPHNFAPLGTWALRSMFAVVVQPKNGDICDIDGSRKQWDGVEWKTMVGKDLSVFHFDIKEDNVYVKGRAVFHYGSLSQAVDQELAYHAFEDTYENPGKTPTYGGLCYVMCVGQAIGQSFMWGNAPQIPSMVFEVARIPHGPNDSGVLYQDPIKDPYGYFDMIGDNTANQLANLLYDANPAHVLWEMLTDVRWGMGKPSADIDHHSFYSAAKILSNEGIGISMLLDTQANWDETLDEVLKVIDGVLYDHAVTGKTTLRLLRPVMPNLGYQDTWYESTNWPTFSEEDIAGDIEFSRGAADEVVNDCKVQFTNRFLDYATDVASDPSIVNYEYLGQRNAVQSTYAAICNKNTALMLAARDLSVLGYPRARGKIRVNRKAYALNKGDRFALNWSPLGISEMVCRVGEIDYGNLESGEIEIQFFQDVFKVNSVSYQDPDDGWTDPAKVDPVSPSAFALMEMPYDLSGDGPRRTFAKLVAKGDEYTTGLRLWSGEGTLTKIGNMPYTPSGLLQSALGLEEHTSTLTIQGVTDAALITSEGGGASGQNLALVEDEIFAWDSHSINSDGTVTFSGVLRGVLDTIPAVHPIGSRVWILEDRNVRELVAHSADFYEADKVQAFNTQGEIALASAPTASGTTTSRQFRPIAPGKFRTGSAADLPASTADQVVVGALPVAWSTRNRLSQAPNAVAQDATPITPESGQVTDIRLSQGMAGMFELVDKDGAAFPFEVSVVVGAANPWATVKGVPLLYLSVGAGAWADTALAPQAGTTYDIGINLATLQVEIVGSAPAANWIPLYRVNFGGAGAGRTATVFDLRTDEPIYIETMAGTENAGSVDPADFGVAPSGVRPYRARLVAVRDGLDSRASRDTGDLLAAGWGVNWGMFWGGN